MDKRESKRIGWEIARTYGVVCFDEKIKEDYYNAKTKEEKDEIINGIKAALESGERQTDLAGMGLPED